MWALQIEFPSEFSKVIHIRKKPITDLSSGHRGFRGGRGDLLHPSFRSVEHTYGFQSHKYIRHTAEDLRYAELAGK